MHVIQKAEVVTFVADKVIASFRNIKEVPAKLEIQRRISRVTTGVEVYIGQKEVKETVVENGKRVQKTVIKEVTKPLVDYFTVAPLFVVKAIQEKILENLSKIKWNTNMEVGDPVKLLKQLKAFSWMIHANSVSDFVYEIIKLMAHSRNSYSELSDEKYSSAIYLKGEVEGGGKSTLLHAIEDGYKAGKVEIENASWPTGRFCNVLPYCRSPVVYIEDTSNYTKKEIQEDKLKALLRKEKVECERKGLDSVTMQANAGIFAAGNVEPPIAKDRCWKVFDVIPAEIEGRFGETKTWKDIKERSREVGCISEIAKNFDFADFQKKLLAFKTKENPKKQETNNENCTGKIPDRLKSRLKYLPTILDVLHEMRNGPFNFNKISAKQIVDFSKEMGDRYELDSWVVVSTLKLLKANEVVLSGRQQTLDIYTKYDLKGLEEENYETAFETTSEVEEEKLLTVEEEVQETLKKWDELITFFDNNNYNNSKPKVKVVIKKKVNKTPIAEEEKDPNDVFADSNETRKYFIHVLRRKSKGPKQTEYLQLYVNERISSKCVLEKKYFLFNDKGEVANESQSKEFVDDMQQVWYSKGHLTQKGLDIRDEDWSKFSKRMMRVVNGTEELHITADIVINNGQIYCSKV